MRFLLALLIPLSLSAQNVTNIVIGQRFSVGTNVSNVIGSGGGGGFTYTIVDHNTGAADSTTQADTGALNTTGANLIIIEVSWFSGTLTLTDSKGNSAPTGLTAQEDNFDGVRFTRLYYLVPDPAKVGSGHVFSATSTSAGFVVINAAAFTKSSGTPSFDAENGVSQSEIGGITVLQTGSVAPAGDNELIVGCSVWNTGTANISVNNSFAVTDQNQCPTANVISGGLFYLIQTSGASVNPTITYSQSVSSYAACIAAFK